MEGLAFETMVVTPAVLIYWFTLPTTPLTLFTQIEGWRMFVLSLSGLVTCIPLILFAYSTRRLKLQTLGMIQYLSPSLKFMCGWLVLHEPLSQAKLQTFVLIWIALAWYTAESFLYLKKKSVNAKNLGA